MPDHKILAVIWEYKEERYRKNKSETMRVAHSSWITFRKDLGMEGFRLLEA
jgi:hypothetical protein